MASDGLRSRAQDAAAADWLRPPEEEVGLSRYLATLRERFWIVIAALVITTGVAVAYVETASKTYGAGADILVTAVSSTNTPVIGIPGIIYQSSDPTRDVETASGLITNVDVATRVQRQLHLPDTPHQLLGKVSATPVGSSNIVAVKSTASSPTAAANLANAFAQQAVAAQTGELHRAIDQRLPQLQSSLRQGTADPTSIRTAIAALETLRSGPNPSMSVQTRAQPPTGPSSPRVKLSIAAGILAGIVLGIGGAFAAQALDPRLRREEQLRRLYRVPILARIPRERRFRGTKPLTPLELSPGALEAYRTLRGTLAVSRRAAGKQSRSILVTGCSPSEGKTTSAINLSSSLATAGNSVILVEADLRRPAIGPALDVQAEFGIASVLVEDISLEDALVSAPSTTANLRLLLADYQGGWISELFTLPVARELLAQARRMADYVILDSPPLTDVIDALPLAQQVDDVLVVVGIGKTHLRKLEQLGELLAENDLRPSGFVVVGTRRPKRSDYHYYAAAAKEGEAARHESRRLIASREDS